MTTTAEGLMGRAHVKDEVAHDTTTLAFERTSLALDRTLMAWIRTAASMITLGFATDKFFYFVREHGAQPHGGLLGPRGFGVAMTGIGVLLLGAAAIQDRVTRKRLRFGKDWTHSAVVPTILMVVLAMLGIVGVTSTVLAM